MVTYFFDTYALIEITKNNPSYIRFLEEPVTTTRFNLTELIYALIAEYGEPVARKIFEKFKDAEAGVSDDVLFKAMEFRMKNKKLNLSYVDCIGYIFAAENNMMFLTGDKVFEGMKNVEFVK